MEGATSATPPRLRSPATTSRQESGALPAPSLQRSSQAGRLPPRQQRREAAKAAAPAQRTRSGYPPKPGNATALRRSASAAPAQLPPAPTTAPGAVAAPRRQPPAPALRAPAPKPPTAMLHERSHRRQSWPTPSHRTCRTSGVRLSFGTHLHAHALRHILGTCLLPPAAAARRVWDYSDHGLKKTPEASVRFSTDAEVWRAARKTRTLCGSGSTPIEAIDGRDRVGYARLGHHANPIRARGAALLQAELLTGACP